MVSIGRTIRVGLLILAAVGFLSGSAWAEQKAQPEQRAAAAKKADPAPPPPPAKRLAPEKAEPYKPACSAPKDQGEKDLCESIRANDLAAKNLYWVRIGTGAVLLSLLFTGWAAWAAAVAAKAATKSVEHAEADATEQAKRFSDQLAVAKQGADAAALLATTAADNLAVLKAQTKPHVTVVGGKLHAEHLTAPFSAQLVFENVGQVAARNTTIILNIGFRPYPLVGDLTTELVPGSISKHTVPPHTKFGQDATMSRAMTSDEMAELHSGVAAIFVWGTIAHDGLVGEPISNSFRFFLGGGFGVRPGFPLTPHEEGNT